MNGWIEVIFFITVVPVFVAVMFTPYLTRRTESFGVSIPEQVYDQPELIAIRRAYVKYTGLLSIALTVLFVFVGLGSVTNEQQLSVLFTVSLVVYLIGIFFVYLYFHRQMKIKKETEKWSQTKPQQTIVHTGFRHQKLTYSNGWFVISFIVTFTGIALTYWMYDRIPEQIPMQYNYSGDVTNWTEKSYRSVMVMPIMQLYLALLFLFINVMIAKAKQQLNAENPEKSLTQTIIFRRRWSAYTIVTGISLTLLFSFIQLSFFVTIPSIMLVVAPLVFGVVVTIGTLILAFTTGQGGSRVKTSIGNQGEVINRDDDTHWKLGQFYFNRNDPALFLEKRFGVGWTINYASPLAWIILLGIILLAVAIPFLLN